jgi:hypothetical protein
MGRRNDCQEMRTIVTPSRGLDPNFAAVIGFTSAQGVPPGREMR